MLHQDKSLLNKSQLSACHVFLNKQHVLCPDGVSCQIESKVDYRRTTENDFIDIDIQKHIFRSQQKAKKSNR